MRQPVRIALVNDYEIVVRGLEAMLAPYGDRVRVVELDCGLPVASEVDVVLYDTFGQSQGLDMDVHAILGDSRARLVVFSWNLQPELVSAALDAGAAGYVSKGVTGADAVALLERVAAGDCVVPDQAAGGVSDRQGDRAGDQLGAWPGHRLGLSPREAEVLALICQGLSNEEITERAYLGLNTVKTYIRTLYAKIGVVSRTQAVLWGVERGFRPDIVRSAGSGPPAPGGDVHHTVVPSPVAPAHEVDGGAG